MVKSSVTKELGLEVDTNSLSVLKGFGNSEVRSLGKTKVVIAIDGVEANLDLLVVPDNAMHVPLMIGQTFTEQPHVLIQKTCDSLEISQLSNQCSDQSKIKLIARDDISIEGMTVVNVLTEPIFVGEFFVEGSFRLLHEVSYSVLTGLYKTRNDGTADLMLNCLSLAPVTLRKGSVLARGRKAYQEVTHRVHHVTAGVGNYQPISLSDLKIGEEVSHKEGQELVSLLNNYRQCFAFNLSELGKTCVAEMVINLVDDEPVVYRPYRLAYSEREKVRNMIEELLQNEIVRPSTSAFASPIVLVKKKTGETRLCIDYRALNKKTTRENYPMPLIDDQLDALAGHAFYTTLDLASGYYQIPIREQDRFKTAFITPDGQFEFNRMPFGLANAPALFQRMMNQVLGSARYKEALAYLDDVIIPSRDIREGMSRLEKILSLFSQAGLTLKLPKCFFFGQKVEYLGFEVSNAGIQPGAKKVEAVEKFPTPQNIHSVRQFLGLASFFRRFVPGFSVVAKPLTQLLKKDEKWFWGTEQEQAFRSLQKALIQKPTLALYNPKAETELHTDACKIGVGGILLQKNESGALKAVAYFSKQTTREEQNYSSYDLETLAVISSLQKFRVYLIGLSFKIVTDCNSLRATFLKRDMLPRVARWWSQMQEFNFDIEYRAGKSMSHVDALSRNPVQEEFNVRHVTDDDWLSTVQDADSDIRTIKGILSNPNSGDVADLLSKYKLKGRKLYRITPEGDRWVVPKGVRWQIVKLNHDDIGHFAVDKTLERIKATYWFAKMRSFVKKYVRSCLECAYSKSSGGKQPGFLHPIEKVAIPFHTIHVDHLGPFVKSSKGNIHILVVIDAFTRFMFLKAVRNTKTQTTIRALQEYFGLFGVPTRLISDRGTSFTSELFKRYMTEKGIKHVLNAVATPRANGQVERYNRTILDALTAKSIGTKETKWDEHLSDVQWGINNTLNKGINRTPSEALFGTRLIGPNEGKLASVLDDRIPAEDHSQRLKSIRDEITSHVKTSQERQKKAYDKSRYLPPQYKVGDLVRVERQIPSTGHSRKLIPKFQGPYRITKIYDHDRYQIESTPLTKKSGRQYDTVVAVDKIRPWLSFDRPHHSPSDSEQSDKSDI